MSSEDSQNHEHSYSGVKSSFSDLRASTNSPQVYESALNHSYDMFPIKVVFSSDSYPQIKVIEPCFQRHAFVQQRTTFYHLSQIGSRLRTSISGLSDPNRNSSCCVFMAKPQTNGEKYGESITVVCPLVLILKDCMSRSSVASFFHSWETRYYSKGL